ncbi:hypothetical protein Ddye_032804, partial [Dipteronia dyeriana]
MAQAPPEGGLLRLPPKLRRKSPKPIPGNSSPHLHRHVYFTEPLSETVPRSLRLSCGSELTDKEFRYLRTVIVTAAVHRASVAGLPCHQ